jgi:hypothetical protein
MAGQFAITLAPLSHAAIRLYRAANYRPCGERSTSSCLVGLNGTRVPSGSTNTTRISLSSPSLGGGTNAVVDIRACR